MASEAGRAGQLFLCAVLAATAIGFYSQPAVAMALGLLSVLLGSAFLGGLLKSRAQRRSARRQEAPVRILHRDDGKAQASRPRPPARSVRLAIRLRCPKCSTIVEIPGGTRPFCRACGHSQKRVVV